MTARRSYETSFIGLFETRSGESEAPVVTHIEIPLIQRDYAQGRRGPAVDEIRDNFLGALRGAVARDKAEPLGLDFVYGEVENGTFRPLDGQQRLTTLFLLHWYLAARTGRLASDQPWTRFSYATRASARLFCERIVAFPPPLQFETTPSDWITDQAWYLHVWRHDPTIEAMLVMMDAIHMRFSDLDADRAWAHLAQHEPSAVTFHLLAIEDMGSEEELYIKMNSRGKPLTPFENFKARLEQSLEGAARAVDFSQKVDGPWADLLWKFRGDDDIVDNEFMRYFEFLIEICEWHDGGAVFEQLHVRAEKVFGVGNPRGAEHLDFLIDAFDTWHNVDVAAVFDELFLARANPSESVDRDRVVNFGSDTDTNLFERCCSSFGLLRGTNRVFGLGQSLLFYAVLLHRIHDTVDFPRRLRTLRNLIEASGFQVRQQRMPELISDTASLILGGSLDDIDAFNQNQVIDERRKLEFIERYPDQKSILFALEDDPILRGSLGSFDLDPETLASRALTFSRVFSDPTNWHVLTAALLASGEYQRSINERSFQFGTGAQNNEATWRDLLTAATWERLEPTRSALARLLDEVAASTLPVSACLSAVRDAWLAERVSLQTFDWRYYFVAYDSMREGRSGIYYGRDGELSYSICMLLATQLNSNYRDPYLLAIWRASGVGEAVVDPFFTGYEWSHRWMQLARSETSIRCVDGGFQLRRPTGQEQEPFNNACLAAGVDADLVFAVPQNDHDGQLLDSVDRIQAGARLLRDLVEAGL